MHRNYASELIPNVNISIRQKYVKCVFVDCISIAVISPSDKFLLFVFMFHKRWVLEQLLMAHRPTAHTRTCSRSSSVIVNAGTYVKQKIDTAATIDLANANSPSLRWHQDIRSKSIVTVSAGNTATTSLDAAEEPITTVSEPLPTIRQK